jgi:arginyl-tRNA synthetase
MVRDGIIEALKKIIGTLGISAEPVLEFPADLAHGDYSANVAMVAAKEAKKNPKALAEDIVAKLGAIEGVSKIEVAGPGFINFHLAREAFTDTVRHIDERWGRNDHVKGYKVLVEYSQPNPFKPFHIGHLMSTTVGEAISRFVEYSGAEIYRANYQGDIGPHIAKCIWGLLNKNLNPANIEDLANAYVIGNSAYEEDPKLKEEIDVINQRLYKNDSDLKKLYDIGRKTSLDRFEEIYKVLGTRFDHYFFESETAPIGMGMVKEGLAKGVFEESDGAVVYKGERAGLHTRVFVTKKGTPTYETKELGLAKAKHDLFPYDLNVTTVAVEQDQYFKVVEAALAELWPEMKGRYTHVAFGMMLLTTGKMSSRKGNVITGESLIEEMRAKALEKMAERDLGEQKQEIADDIAVAAVKYSILKQGTGKNIIFDPEQSLSLEGDSGPYLQYSYTRAMSVLRKAEGKADAAKPAAEVPAFERLLSRFPDVVFRAAKEYEPHHATTYLTELASAFNSWYANERIIGSPEEAYKLALTRAFATTMKNGLWLLGIRAPEKM